MIEVVELDRGTPTVEGFPFFDDTGYNPQTEISQLHRGARYNISIHRDVPGARSAVIAPITVG